MKTIIWETAGAGAIPAGAYDVVDPLLEAKTNGIFRPQSGSPAIDSAIGDYPDVIVDADGQPRTAPKDKGADEVSSEQIVATLLTAGDLLRLIHARPNSASPSNHDP